MSQWLECIVRNIIYPSNCDAFQSNMNSIYFICLKTTERCKSDWSIQYISSKSKQYTRAMVMRFESTWILFRLFEKKIKMRYSDWHLCLLKKSPKHSRHGDALSYYSVFEGLKCVSNWNIFMDCEGFILPEACSLYPHAFHDPCTRGNHPVDSQWH